MHRSELRVEALAYPMVAPADQNQCHRRGLHMRAVHQR